jgi:hypothetical protein
MEIPKSIYAGDTIEWTDSLSDYSASAGYILHYTLSGMNKRITIDGVTDGGDHGFTISAADSAAYVAGWYQWQAYVTKGAERYTIENGRIEIKPNLAVAGGMQEGRSVWQITVENLETVIKNKSTEGYASISVGTPSGTSRAIGKMTWAEIYSALAYAKRQLAIDNNGGKKKRILAEFSPA